MFDNFIHQLVGLVVQCWRALEAMGEVWNPECQKLDIH